MAVSGLVESPDPDLHQPSDELLWYIRSLSDNHLQYSRYFSALLIPSSSHAAFYVDLRSFRELEDVLPLFLNADPTSQTLSLTSESTTTLTSSIDTSATLSSSSSPISSRELNRRITTAFLASRYAHPWCQSTIPHSTNPTVSKPGWTKALFGTSKTTGIESRKEEEKLHKLLLPIWIAFRAKMNPTAVTLERWVQDERRRDEERRVRVRDTIDPKPTNESENKHSRLEKSKSNVRTFDIERYVEGDDSSDEDSTLSSRQQSDDSSAAAKLFVGIAATGLFMSQNKRTRKYITKKLNKKI